MVSNSLYRAVYRDCNSFNTYALIDFLNLEVRRCARHARPDTTHPVDEGDEYLDETRP